MLAGQGNPAAPLIAMRGIPASWAIDRKLARAIEADPREGAIRGHDHPRACRPADNAAQLSQRSQRFSPVQANPAPRSPGCTPPRVASRHRRPPESAPAPRRSPSSAQSTAPCASFLGTTSSHRPPRAPIARTQVIRRGSPDSRRAPQFLPSPFAGPQRRAAGQRMPLAVVTRHPAAAASAGLPSPRQRRSGWRRRRTTIESAMRSAKAPSQVNARGTTASRRWSGCPCRKSGQRRASEDEGRAITGSRGASA